jgi:hypothetical protein
MVGPLHMVYGPFNVYLLQHADIFVTNKFKEIGHDRFDQISKALQSKDSPEGIRREVAGLSKMVNENQQCHL